VVLVHGAFADALVPLHYPAAGGGEPAVEFAINPARFHDAFAADLPTDVILDAVATVG
jgi:hypothetical protein